MNYTVTQVSFFIKQILMREEILYNIAIEGEITNYNLHKSGHMFFNLKDENSSLKCIFFKTDARRIEFFPKEGMKVCVRGDIRAYEKDGVYQLYGHKMEMGGEGEIKQKKEDLVKKLEKEGMFEKKHKKSIPLYPNKIGVVTAINSAALKDIVNIIDRRYPIVKLELFASLVQGKDASKELCKAVKRASRSDVDVIIIGRGGGQVEDLVAFDDEQVVREVFKCKTPVISAVGHEKDNSLVDMVADLRASTPSAAAELAVPEKEEIYRHLELIKKILYNNITKILITNEQEFVYLSRRLEKSSIINKINSKKIRLQNIERKLKSLIEKKYTVRKNRLDLVESRLNTLSPLGVLKRGYALIYKEGGDLVKSVDDVMVGEKMEVKIQDGNVETIVNNIKEMKNG